MKVRILVNMYDQGVVNPEDRYCGTIAEVVSYDPETLYPITVILDGWYTPFKLSEVELLEEGD